MAHFVVIGDDIAATAAALTLAEMGQPVTMLLNPGSIPIADMWRIGETPLNPTPMQAVDWYQRQYEWINASKVRWLYNTPGLPMWCVQVEQDSETGELILYDESETPWAHAAAVIYTQIGGKPAPPTTLQPERYYGRGLSQSAWSDGEYFRRRPVVVLGCGAQAVEQACHLAQVASWVTMLCEEPGFTIPADLSEVTRLPNVVLHPGVKVDALVASADGGIAAVEFRRGAASVSVETAAVFVAFNPELSWEVWGSRERALGFIEQQRLYLAGVPAGVPYRDHSALFQDGQRAARQAAARWGNPRDLGRAAVS